MSTAEFGDLNLGQAPTPAPDSLITPLTLTPPTPVEPAAQPPAAPPVEVQAAPIPVSDMREVPLGTLIFREGLLTEEQLEEALQDGMKRGKRLGEVLLERGLVSENDLGRLLAGQKGLQFVQLDAATVDPSAVQLLSVEKARLHSVLPIGFQDGLPVVAVVDPSNDLVLENVRRALNCEPRLVVAGREALHRQIELAYAAPSNGVAPVVSEPQTLPSTAVAEHVVSVVSQPAEPVVAEPVAPAVEPLAPPAPVVQPEPVAAQGVWLGDPQPVVETPPPVVEPEPVVQPEPVFQAEPLVASEPAQPVLETQVAPPPVTEPVAISYTPVEPVTAPEPPVAPEPVFTPEPVVTQQPVVAPEPVAEAPAVEQPPAEPQTETWYVVLRLADGERIDVGAFGSSEAATAHARSIVEQISTQTGWPFFEGRFLRPEAIVSVDLVAPEGRWLGSAARRQWDSGQQA